MLVTNEAYRVKKKEQHDACKGYKFRFNDLVVFE